MHCIEGAGLPRGAPGVPPTRLRVCVERAGACVRLWCPAVCVGTCYDTQRLQGPTPAPSPPLRLPRRTQVVATDLGVLLADLVGGDTHTHTHTHTHIHTYTHTPACVARVCA